MNTKLIIIIAVILVLGGAGVYAFMSNNNSEDESTANTSSSTTQTSTNNETEQQQEAAAESGNIFSVVDAGKAQKCTFSYSGSNGEGSGTMFSDGAGRGLMTIDVKTDKGNTGTSNTLVQADKVYGWTETDGGEKIGFVYDKSSITNSSNSTATQNSSVDPNQKFDLECQSWTVDEAILAVPQDVNFLSLPTGQ